MPNFSASFPLQIISPVESDVVLEDMFERTTTANSSASIEEDIDKEEGNISGNWQFLIHFIFSLTTVRDVGKRHYS